MRFLLNQKTIYFYQKPFVLLRGFHWREAGKLKSEKYTSKCVGSISLLIAFVFLTGCHNTNQKKSPSKSFALKKSGKLMGHMILEIQPSSPDSSTLLLSAGINPLEDFGLAQVEWKVPESVSVQEGLVQQQMELKQRQTYRISLTLSVDSLKDGDQIFLFVYKMINGEKHGTTTSYTHHSSEN